MEEKVNPMEQIILRVKLPSGIIYFISNTNSDFVVALEDHIVAIGIRELDIYKDTKQQLVKTTIPSLKQLERCLKLEITKNPQSPDNKGFSEMLKAIREIIAEREPNLHSK